MSSSSLIPALYGYEPSKGLPIAFGVIVTILAILLFYQSFLRYKWYHFGFMVTWASLVWIPSFICRGISIYGIKIIDLYIAQYVLLLSGPILYASSEYFILGRLLSYVPYHAPLHPGRALSTFLFLSAAVEGLSAAGASTIATSNTRTSGNSNGFALVEAGLILQAVVEILFISLVVLVANRCRKAGHFIKPIRTICYVLCTTSSMMLIRCVFRVIQSFEQAGCPRRNSNCGTVDRNEWFLWIFEVANITVMVATLVIFHPGRYLPSNKNVYLDPKDGKTERIGPGFSKASKRSFIATLLDPFNLVGIIAGNAAEELDPYWDRNNPTAQENESP